MTEDQTGRVSAVTAEPLGDELAEAATAGASFVTVDDAADFNEDGGFVLIAEQVLEYETVDDETGVLTFADSVVLDADADAGDRVDLWDPEAGSVSMEWVAYVVVEGSALAEDTVEAVIEHALIPFLPEGIRQTQGEGVTLSWIGDELFVTNILGKTPLFDAGLLDPNTSLPDGMGAQEPVEPDHSPTPTTVGGLRQVFVKYDAVDNASLVTYEVHVTETSGASAPTPGDSATLLKVDPATMVVASALPDGTPFVYDWDDDTNEATPDVPKNYYFSVIARSGDLTAAPSPWVVGRMDRAASADLVAGSVTTELLNSVLAILGTLQIGGGLIELSPPTSADDGDGGLTLGGGIVIKDPSNPEGEPFVRLHPLGCTFRGQVTADIVTVLQDLIINGDMSLSGGSTFTARNGVPDPTTGPTWSVGWQSLQEWPAPPAGMVRRGLAWDSANTRWIEALKKTSTDRPHFRTVSTAGTPGTAIALPYLSASFGNNEIVGVVAIGSNLFFAQEQYDNAEKEYEHWILKTNMSGTKVAETILTPGVSNPGKLRVGSAGSQLIIGSENALYLMDTDLTLAQSAFGIAPTEGTLLYGSFDLGGTRLLTCRGYSDGYLDGVKSYTVNWGAETKTAVPAEDFLLSQLYTSMESGSFVTWDGTRFVSLVAGATALRAYSGYLQSSDGVWSARYADTTAGGSTAGSPSTTATVLSRQFATLTLSPAPTGVTGTDVWVGYAASGDAGTKYKRAETLSGRALFLSALKQTSGATTIPSSSTAGGSPAVLKSEATPGWEGSGDGTFSVKTPTSSGHAANKAYVDSGQFVAAEDLSSLGVTSGVTINRLAIKRTGKWREINGSFAKNLATGTTTMTDPIAAGDWPEFNIFASCYLTGGNIGVVFVRNNGEIAITNQSGAARNGNHQFTVIYSVN